MNLFFNLPMLLLLCIAHKQSDTHTLCFKTLFHYEKHRILWVCKVHFKDLFDFLNKRFRFFIFQMQIPSPIEMENQILNPVHSRMRAPANVFKSIRQKCIEPFCWQPEKEWNSMNETTKEHSNEWKIK
jgi:hypothetical protein